VRPAFYMAQDNPIIWCNGDWSILVDRVGSNPLIPNAKIN